MNQTGTDLAEQARRESNRNIVAERGHGRACGSLVFNILYSVVAEASYIHHS
jgi:hypothetical protein